LLSRKAIALLSLLFTYLFFFEYIPPFRWVHIPYDLQGFHYPLADYAFLSLRNGRFPLWDPTIYSGMSFIGNIQAALFYPPTWLMFLFSWGRERLSYQSMQDVLLLHVWAAFLLCYLWLRGKRLAQMACVLGAGVFAYSGYVCTQLQHFGLIGGYTWMPLALWGIDEAVERRSWGPLWKVAVASALAFLAGYPPTWMVFATVVGVYAIAGAWRWKAALGAIAALMFSLILGAVQILPTLETMALREPELKYGLGTSDPQTVLFYILPNYFNFGFNVPIATNPYKDYFYLGVPALMAVAFLFRRRFRDLLPSLAIMAASLVVAVNPLNVVWNVIQHWSLLADVIRSWYFFAGVTLAFAPLTAYGLDDFLARKGSAVRPWVIGATIVAMALWASSELIRWKHQSLAAGWRSGLDLTVTLTIFIAGINTFRGARGRRRAWMAAALVLFAGADYKAFGTSKRFDAGAGDAQRWSFTSLPGVDPEVYKRLRADNGYRIVVDDELGPLPGDFRHIGLMSPQGFDPFLTTPYRKLAETNGHFRTDREFEIDPENYEALSLFGVKYVISAEQSKTYPKLKNNPNYRFVGSEAAFYKVYEYVDAQPPFSWEGPPDGRVERLNWEPEHRSFAVRSEAGGKLALHEQFFPGWEARIDGKDTPEESWRGAFQSVAVPPGEHTVEFRYRSRRLGAGGAISMLALIGLGFWIRANSRSGSGTAYPAASE